MKDLLRLAYIIGTFIVDHRTGAMILPATLLVKGLNARN
jgi:hypothetical protein